MLAPSSALNPLHWHTDIRYSSLIHPFTVRMLLLYPFHRHDLDDSIHYVTRHHEPPHHMTSLLAHSLDTLSWVPITASTPLDEAFRRTNLNWHHFLG